MLGKYISQIYKIITKIFWIIGGILSFLVIADLIRAYKSLNNVNPWLGYLLLILIFGVLLWLFILIINLIIKRQKTYFMPKMNDWNSANTKQIKKYNSYLLKRHKQLLNIILNEDHLE